MPHDAPEPLIREFSMRQLREYVQRHVGRSFEIRGSCRTIHPRASSERPIQDIHNTVRQEFLLIESPEGVIAGVIDVDGERLGVERGGMVLAVELLIEEVRFSAIQALRAIEGMPDEHLRHSKRTDIRASLILMQQYAAMYHTHFLENALTGYIEDSPAKDLKRDYDLLEQQLERMLRRIEQVAEGKMPRANRRRKK